MSKPRTLITVSYRVLNESGRCMEVIKKTGLNKRYLQWMVERLVAKKYGKNFKIHAYKVVEET